MKDVIKTFVIYKLPDRIRRVIWLLIGWKLWIEWILRGYAPPIPPTVKRMTIKRNAIQSSWFIETGTYLGDTADFFEREGYRVITIEVDRRLFERADKRFHWRGVRCLLGDSASLLPDILSELHDPVTFWLDGHYSGEITGHSSSETPIRAELDAVGQYHMNTGYPVTVLVDDVRCFDTSAHSNYPSISYLSHWAEAQGMQWHIEFDIFIARSEAKQ